MKKNTMLLWILALGGIIVCLIAFYKSNKLLNNHKLTNAIITKCQFLPKTGGSINIHYQYAVDRKVKKGSRRSTCNTSLCNRHLLGKSFPVIYNPDDDESSLLLMMPSEFKRYGYTFPDSLKWVLNYIGK